MPIFQSTVARRPKNQLAKPYQSKGIVSYLSTEPECAVRKIGWLGSFPSQPMKVGLEEKFEEINSKILTNFYYRLDRHILSSRKF